MKKSFASSPFAPALAFALAAAFLAGCASTGPAASKFYADKLVAARDYQAVVRLLDVLGQDAVRRASGGGETAAAKFWGEPFDAVALRARKAIAADATAYKAAIMALLASGEQSDRICAIRAATLAFDRDYMEAIGGLFGDRSVLVRQQAVYYFLPDGDVGARWQDYSPELKAEIAGLLSGVVKGSGDLVMIEAALSVLRAYKVPGSRDLPAKLLADFDAYARGVNDPLRGLPIDSDQRDKLKALFADTVDNVLK
jgi:hypothetical protein